MQVAGLDLGDARVEAVVADAAPEPAGVVGDDGAVGQVGGQRPEPGGVHRLADHEQRGAPVGGRERPRDVVDEVDLGEREGAGLHGPVRYQDQPIEN